MSILIAFAARLLLVMLFFPFSALDKLLNFRDAVGQALQAAPTPWIARTLIVAGLAIEVTMSISILAGVADRLAAVIMAGYCIVTAFLWKQFWKAPDFRLKGSSQGRGLFWDFLKNLSIAGGFLLLAVGTDGTGVSGLATHPFASTHPYAVSVRADSQP
jgi:putative oxidoreductase